MPLPEEISEEIEADRLDREGELRLIEAFLAAATDPAQGRMLRRTLVLLNYAHLEGFVRFALSAYQRAVNAEKIKFREASIPVGAASAGDIFAALRNDQSKHDLFRRDLPDDTILHRVARQQRFVEEYEGKIGDTVVAIPDSVVNTESSLSAAVLKRNLFILGLPADCADKYASEINQMMHIRHAIAHGDRLRDPKPELVQAQREAVAGIMSALRDAIVTAVAGKAYRRTERSIAA